MLSNPVCKNPVVHKNVRPSQVDLTSMNRFHLRLKARFKLKETVWYKILFPAIHLEEFSNFVNRLNQEISIDNPQMILSGL